MMALVRHLLGGDLLPADPCRSCGRSSGRRTGDRLSAPWSSSRSADRAWAGRRDRRRGRCRWPSARTPDRPRRWAWRCPVRAAAVFHLMLVLSSQLTGGSAFGAVPFASGPRHWCQLSSRSLAKSSARRLTEKSAKQRAKVDNCLMVDDPIWGLGSQWRAGAARSPASRADRRWDCRRPGAKEAPAQIGSS